MNEISLKRFDTLAPQTILLIQLLTFWPVWLWYVTTLRDPAEDPSVLVAFGTALVFLIGKSVRRQPSSSIRFPVLLSVFVLYLLAGFFGSPLLRAAIAVIAVSYILNCWRFGGQSQPWLYGLILLSLPLIAPLQFYVSYPVRLLVGHTSTLLLQQLGFPVFFEGLAFNYNGSYIWVDELCSGIRKLWAGLYFACALAAFYGLRVKKTCALIGFAAAAFIMANVLRTTVLFYVKTDFLTLPDWLHKSSGVLMFLLAALATVGFVEIVLNASRRPPEHLSSSAPYTQTTTKDQQRLLNGVFLLCCLIAAFTPFLSLYFAQQRSAVEFPGWPEQFEGKSLQTLPLTAHEQGFLRSGFADPIARFTDGERELIVRWTPHASRTVRSAWDALQGQGYRFGAGLAVWRDDQGNRWRMFEISRATQTWRMLEAITDESGQRWTDVSNWYWDALLGKTEGPWWVTTIIEPVRLNPVL